MKDKHNWKNPDRHKQEESEDNKPDVENIEGVNTFLFKNFTKSTSSLLGGENITIVAYKFTDTKIDIEFFFGYNQTRYVC